MSIDETSKQEILSAINTFANTTEERFGKIDKRFEVIDERLDKIEGGMVTKDYLDEKLAKLKGELVLLTRKEDTKLTSLIDTLRRRQAITEQDRKHLLALEPFAQEKQ